MRRPRQWGLPMRFTVLVIVNVVNATQDDPSFFWPVAVVFACGLGEIVGMIDAYRHRDWLDEVYR